MYGDENRELTFCIVLNSYCKGWLKEWDERKNLG